MMGWSMMPSDIIMEFRNPLCSKIASQMIPTAKSEIPKGIAKM